MKHSRVSVTDYEPRMAALEADNCALRASNAEQAARNAQLETAVLDLLGRFKAMQRANELLFGALIRDLQDDAYDDGETPR